MCPSGCISVTWEPLSGEEGYGVGVVHGADEACLNYPTDYAFHARSYRDLTNQLPRASLL